MGLFYKISTTTSNTVYSAIERLQMNPILGIILFNAFVNLCSPAQNQNNTKEERIKIMNRSLLLHAELAQANEAPNGLKAVGILAK